MGQGGQGGERSEGGQRGEGGGGGSGGSGGGKGGNVTASFIDLDFNRKKKEIESTKKEMKRDANREMTSPEELMRKVQIILFRY